MKKRFSLHERIRLAYARDSDRTVSRHCALDFGIDIDKFTYFAISVVWRAAVVQWMKQDGQLTQPIHLGAFEEDMRRYLMGEIPQPFDMAVIVIVCSDVDSRNRVFYPGGFVEAGCINFRFQARGVLFRLMIGNQMSPYLRQHSCTSPLKCILYGDCKARTLEDTGEKS